MWWLLAFCGVVESNRFRQLGLGFERLTLENAGDCDFGKAFYPKTAEGQVQIRMKELKNGRLAMLAFGGIITQAVLFNNHQFPWTPLPGTGVGPIPWITELSALAGPQGENGPVCDIVVSPDAPFAGGLVGTQYNGWNTPGGYEFDPAELAGRFPEALPWFREAELKHGRLCMLACVGSIAPNFFRIPVPICEDPHLDLVNSHNLLTNTQGLGTGPMWWLLAFCGVVESNRFKQLGLGFERLTLENAGDCDFGKAFYPKTAEGQVQIRMKELKNGRLAMLAFGGIITQAVLFNNHQFPWTPLPGTGVGPIPWITELPS